MKAFLIKYCSSKHRSYYYKVNSETKITKLQQSALNIQ